MRVIALSIDDDDEVRTQIFTNERDLFEHLRVNYAADLDVDPGTPEGQKEIHDDLEFQRLAYKWDWHEIPLNIEILHGRDPDASCELTVFVNGEPSDSYAQQDVDPGAGHERASWDESTDLIAKTVHYSEAFRTAVVNERNEAADHSQYIEGEPEEPPREPRFQPGQELFFTPSLKSVRPGQVLVVRVLGDDQRDAEVGHMYEVVYIGTTADTEDAFEDELMLPEEHERIAFEGWKSRLSETKED